MHVACVFRYEWEFKFLDADLTRGPFLEATGNYRARKAVLFSIPDGSFKRYYTVKLLVKETKWTLLEVRTHPYLRLWFQNNMTSGLLGYRDFRETGT